MVTKIRIELVCPTRYNEIERTIELPFVPVIGMQIQFDLVEKAADSGEADHSYPSPGIVTVGRLLYRMNPNEFLVTSYLEFNSEADLLSAQSQFIHYHGFSQEGYSVDLTNIPPNTEDS